MTPVDNISLKPAISFALLKVMPMIILSLAFLLLAWYLSPYFIFFSLLTIAAAFYRMLFIKSFQYLISAEYIRLTKGLFFKRVDQLEMYRIKDYIITQTFALQTLGLMNLTLKSTDPENPVITMAGIPDSAIIDTIRERVQQARHLNNIYELN